MRLQRPKGNAASSGICFPTEGLLHIHKDLKKKWCWSWVHFVVFIEAFVIVHHWRTWWRSLAQYRWFLETWHCCNLCSTFPPYTYAFLFDGTATRRGVGVLPKITFTFIYAYFRNHHMSTLCIVNRHSYLYYKNQQHLKDIRNSQFDNAFLYSLSCPSFLLS